MVDQRHDFEPQPNSSSEVLRDSRGHVVVQYAKPARKTRRSRLRLAIIIVAILVVAGAVAVGVFLAISTRSSNASVAATTGRAADAAASGTTRSLTSFTTTTTRPAPTPTTAPAVLPPTGKFWFGMTVDNTTDIPIRHWTLDGSGGVRPMLGHIFILLQPPVNATTPSQLADYFLNFFGGMPANGVLMFTVEPFNGISVDEAPDDAIQALADAWRELNVRGYQVLVRPCHEMNGGWYPWGRIPTLYREFWIRFATIVRATAPITSLIWSPTISDTYPYDQRKVPANGSADMALLDTNGNGVLDGGDDPYAAYWPGDDWVDWVSGSVYYYGPSWPYTNNFVPAGTWLERIITGRVTLTGEQRGPSFYDVYSAQKGKPFIFSETAVYHWPNGTGATEVAQKQGFWRLALNRTAQARFPNIRAMAWFEIAKIETAWQNQFVDFAIGNNSDVLNAFLSDVTPPGNSASNIDTNMFLWG